MRADGEIGKKFFLVKISTYTVLPLTNLFFIATGFQNSMACTASVIGYNQELIMRDEKRVSNALCTPCNMYSESNMTSRLAHVIKPRR